MTALAGRVSGEWAPELAAWPGPESLLAAWRFGRLPRVLYPHAVRQLLAAYGSVTALAAAAGLGRGTVQTWVGVLTDATLGPTWAAGELTWAEARALARLGGPYRAAPLATLVARRRDGRPLRLGERQRLLAAAQATQLQQRKADQARADALVSTIRGLPSDDPLVAATLTALAALDVPTSRLAAALDLSEATLRRRLAAHEAQGERRTQEAACRERALVLASSLRGLPPQSPRALARYRELAALAVPQGWLAAQLGIHRDTLRRRLAKALALATAEDQALTLVHELRDLPVHTPKAKEYYRALAALEVPQGWLAAQLGIHRDTLRRRLGRAAESQRLPDKSGSLPMTAVWASGPVDDGPPPRRTV